MKTKNGKAGREGGGEGRASPPSHYPPRACVRYAGASWGTGANQWLRRHILKIYIACAASARAARACLAPPNPLPPFSPPTRTFLYNKKVREGGKGGKGPPPPRINYICLCN